MAKRGLRSWAALALVLVAGCTAPPSTLEAPAPSPPPPTLPAPPPVAVSPPALSAAPPPVRPAPIHDACGAWELQSLIGRPRTEIPVPVDPSRRQVLCSTCPVSPDYVPYRQTIIYDAESGLVKDVRCG
jgi:hypothetical protein